MILVLTGPTGTGKSDMAISLAKKLDAVIVNADAFQVYKELGIATAKPSEEMRMQVPHYLYDFVSLDSAYNVYEYQKDLRAVLAEQIQDGRNVIIAGGTGLYIRAGLYDYEFGENADVDLSSYEALSNEELHDVLSKMDEEEAKKIHPNNRVRVLRAISLCLSSGRKKSEMVGEQSHKPIYKDLYFYGLTGEREDIYSRTDERVERMFKAGLIEEVASLSKKYGREAMAFRAIGVKELFPYLDGKQSLEEAKEAIKKNTRNYVKRQLTFCRHQFDIHWITKEEDILEDLRSKGVSLP